MKHWFKDQHLRSLLKNTSYLGVSKAVAALCGLATLALAGRGLGVVMFGMLILISSYIKAVSGIAKFQSWQLIVRYGGHGIAHGDPEHFKVATGFAFGLDVLSGIAGLIGGAALLPFIGTWVGITPQYLWLGMLYCTVLPVMAGATPDGVLRVLDRFDLISWASTLMPISRAILAAAAFHWTGHHEVAEIQDAYALLSPTLGVGVASTLFAVALLASGQNSTLTGTLAGQIVMEGFLNFRITPWLRRLITRGSAIVPAVAIIGYYGESKTTELLVASQVVLSMQLGFAVWPLMRFTGEKAKMGEFVNPVWIKVLGWTVAAVIITLNVKLLFDTFAPEAVRKAFYNALGLSIE